ncbi:hypothetical protein [Pararhodobacter oceanensis]|uniref:hypothetical protein n=1 Tax=Pararhodobacter oceanensis TaxID=2172121 RepID=UPI003A8DE530
MTAQPSTLDRIGNAMRLPFNLFADDNDRMLERLDDMHKTVPTTLPKNRLFKH